MEDEVRHILRNAVKESGRRLPRSAPALRRCLLACPSICRSFATRRRGRLNSNLDHPRHQRSLGAHAESSGSICRTVAERQPAESVWITSITLFEASLGLALPAFEQLLVEDLEERVLDFDRFSSRRRSRPRRRKATKGPNHRHARHSDRGHCHRPTCGARNEKRHTLCGPHCRGRESVGRQAVNPSE
jgi:hypothetical protein